ncbi:hypothetical protein [Helicobacter zhangjianzhongii]|uniref:Uncharacterized protein n=1 Tax=Helicobacter zhangjianzhongii TaxID=2974574 RepID=A0ACC6FQV4_9HELI|nr:MULTISPECIES: hypothetical protein [unclassified Helicobacter]MDL0079594.1 hypothetical protein [Helicobacter sp. CPD2-1]MDL0081507.1 hypothetical protein [Helicobacter sp. XJK30-2]
MRKVALSSLRGTAQAIHNSSAQVDSRINALSPSSRALKKGAAIHSLESTF